MSEPYNKDDEVLARLVREAGDPDVTPDPQFAETLRTTILDRVATTEAQEILLSPKRTLPMRRISRFAVAATVLVAAGLLTLWMTTGGGSNAMAFSRVADALDKLRSATYDITVTSTEEKGVNGQPPVTSTATGRGYFHAPSLQRMEISVEIPERKTDKFTVPKQTMDQVMIADGEAAKCMMLTPNLKLAVVMDMKKVCEDMETSGQGVPPDVFEMVRRLVREGSSGTGEKSQSLGTKEIDGREAVGFKTRGEIGDMILWADPETAWPVHIELTAEILGNVRTVMSNFRHDVELAPSLFSLEPPEGYSSQTLELVTPVEEDLLNTLRTIAENSEGLFPAKLGMNKEVMESLMAGTEPTMEMDEPAQVKLQAAMNEVLAKYGGEEELRKKYGKDKKPPPEIMAEVRKATASIMQEHAQEHAQEQVQENIQKTMPLRQKRMRGLTFYTMLKPANDPHYAGEGVTLGTSDRPIFWYKPTGADNYRVIYADLSVKDMTSAEAKKLAEGVTK